VREGCGIVMSPLIALMRDQVAGLRERRQRGGAQLDAVDRRAPTRSSEPMSPASSIFSTSPPSGCRTPRPLAMLPRQDRSACSRSTRRIASRNGATISGPNISAARRPRRTVPNGVPRIALTATADDLTTAGDRAAPGLEDAPHFVASFDRPNIKYRIVDKTERAEAAAGLHQRPAFRRGRRGLLPVARQGRGHRGR
jgi:ATP-dependent DNA helicase RecQ